MNRGPRVRAAEAPAEREGPLFDGASSSWVTVDATGHFPSNVGAVALSGSVSGPAGSVVELRVRPSSSWPYMVVCGGSVPGSGTAAFYGSCTVPLVRDRGRTTFQVSTVNASQAVLRACWYTVDDE
jgi:hypothetical protein